MHKTTKSQAYLKIKKVIDSCEKWTQVNTADKMVYQFDKIYNNRAKDSYNSLVAQMSRDLHDRILEKMTSIH
jgi:hypothetical protein